MTSLIGVFDVIYRHMKLIIITTLIVLFATGFTTFFVISPKYESTTELLVNRKLSTDLQSAQFQQVQADVQMISTYKDIITSPAVLNTVMKKVRDYPESPTSSENLAKSISISNQQNSQVFSVSAKSANKNTAALIANETARVFKSKVGKIMNIDNVSIVSTATPSSKPYSPKKVLSLLAGLVVGLVLGISLAFIREVSDNTVTNEEFLKNMGWVNLGQVSEMDNKKNSHQKE
ncbi:chain-length determining protein [Companilactobacillus allii]|uniref:Capsular polysaccharide biosynthesis protein CpsC n=2 Tax=Companilactobacillus allii TaxID=1847728 RepID=A0A1P8Q660_9LACO|nr:Wzz/FepE/Etk N-terminal domain-containing protein [Companilactobacillus allii]APX73336.1 chain-length determining protein [Companilactobacillus allii]